MKKRILNLSLKALIAFFVLGSANVFAQTASDNEEYESLLANWKTAAKDLRQKLGLSTADFVQFREFYQSKNDSMKLEFCRKIKAGKITETNVRQYLAFVESNEIYLYKQFVQIKKDYPSSVSEYTLNKNKRPYATCNPGCTNVDFSNGTLSGWNAYYAENSSTAASFNIVKQVGGPCGAVTAAANDPNTNFGGTGPDYQIEIKTGGNDPLAPVVPMVYPFGASKYSVRVGDSTNPNQGVAILNQTFMVTAANSTLTYEYAVFLENPSSNPHTYYQQPFFNVEVLNASGDTISHCQYYNVVSGGAAQNGYDSVYYAPTADYIYYKNWQVVFSDLKRFIGQCVTLQFESADCSLGGHFGYAYIDATCTPVSIITSSPVLCGQNHITLTAPLGAATYSWSGPPGGIVGSDSTQVITIDSAGNYSVVVTPVTGKSCGDTLFITIKKVTGVTPPIPSFKADTVCAGVATQFTNTSNPLSGSGVSFYWDFYNIGVVNDSTTNPTWTFSGPGVYTVKLNELNNGCGYDTLIKIKVDSVPVPAFTATNACAGQSVTFTNNTTGANSYSWSFGDGGTSTAVSPSHTYPTGGTYTVTLVANNTGKCNDSIKKAITINAVPKITVTGKDTICPGTSTKLTASGAGNYIWQPGNKFGKSITVSPSATTTYTVSGSNGTCTGDTTVVVVVLPTVTLTLTATPDTICSGNSTTLNVSGGASTYTWAPNTNITPTTGATVTATPTTSITYIVTAAKGANGCSAIDSVHITVLGGAVKPKVTLSSDSNCAGTNVTLTASGASSYLWSTGATTSSITVAPVTLGGNPFSVTFHSICRADTTINLSVFVEPTPNPVISGKDSICPGTSTLLTASSTVGFPGYLWNNGSRNDTLTVAPSVNTTYTVIAADGRCTQQATFTVSIRPVPVVTANAAPKNICKGDSTTLTANGAKTYTWAPTTKPATGALVNAAPTVSTTYTVTGNTGGCVATATVNVVVLSNTITGTISLSSDSVCQNVLLTLTANASVSGASYLWSTGQVGNAITVGKNDTVGNNHYWVIISSKCAVDTVRTIVFVEPTPNPVITGNNLICAGTKTVLTVNSTVGFPGYLWSNGGTNNPRGSSIVVDPTTQTVYTVTAADGRCAVTVTDTVKMEPTPVVTVTGPTSICQNDTIRLTATGGGTYRWFNGMTGSSISFVAPGGSTFNAYVIVTNGCQDSTAHFITPIPAPNVVACCDTTIDLGGTAKIGASGAISYVWDPSNNVGSFTSANTTATPTVTTTYTVVGTDANGCTASAIVIVEIACQDFTVPNVFTPNGDNENDTFFIKGSSGEPNYEIEIYNRWGVEVYKSNNPSQSWDGKDKAGVFVSDGVYYYIIKSTCGTNNYDKHGFVQVIR